MQDSIQAIPQQQLIKTIRALGAANCRQRLAWRKFMVGDLKEGRRRSLEDLVRDWKVEDRLGFDAAITLTLVQTVIGGPTLELSPDQLIGRKIKQMELWAAVVSGENSLLGEWGKPTQPFLWLSGEEQEDYLLAGEGDLRAVASLCGLSLPEQLPSGQYSAFERRTQRWQHSLGFHGVFWASEASFSLTCQACNKRRDR